MVDQGEPESLPFSERVENATTPRELLNLVNETGDDFSKRQKPLYEKFMEAKSGDQEQKEKEFSRQIKVLTEEFLGKSEQLDKRLLLLFPDIDSMVKASLVLDNDKRRNQFVWWYCHTAAYKSEKR